jgi:hypothetical protein
LRLRLFTDAARGYGVCLASRSILSPRPGEGGTGWVAGQQDPRLVPFPFYPSPGERRKGERYALLIAGRSSLPRRPGQVPSPEGEGQEEGMVVSPPPQRLGENDAYRKGMIVGPASSLHDRMCRGSGGDNSQPAMPTAARPPIHDPQRTTHGVRPSDRRKRSIFHPPSSRARFVQKGVFVHRGSHPSRPAVPTGDSSWHRHPLGHRQSSHICYPVLI